MILDLSKATKRKCLKMYFQTPCWRQQMFGKGSLDLCRSQSLVHRLAAPASPGQLVRNTDFWPCPIPVGPNQTLRKSPSDSDWTRGISLET